MKNHYKWLTAFLLVVSVFLGMTSCQPETEIKYVEVEKQPDGVAPADVTNLVVTNKDASVLLTWTDATDEDIYGYEVSWKTSTENRAAAAMESNSLIVAPGAKGCYVTNLENGTGYTFTVQTVDVTGMKSTGVTKTITPSIIVGAAADISLVPSTTEKTNQDVTVKVEINSEIAESVEKITCARGLYTEIYEVLNGTDITETKEFTATSNNTYTVAITYTDETYNFFFVKITNIDKTAPSNVTNVITTYSKETGKITLSWENPTDEDFVGTKIVYGLEGSEETTTLAFDKDTTETVLENVEGTYKVKIYAMDDVENFSAVYTFFIGIGIPKITSVSIPVAGTDYAGNVLPVRINGINFKALDTGGATASGFTSTGATLTNVRIISDTLAIAEITCPSVIGTTDVTVSYGDSSATTTLKVIESVASSYTVGDIILTNGTKVSVNDVETYTIDENNKPIGVVAMISSVYGFSKPKVIGLQKSASSLIWAPEDTTGYNTVFTNIVCTPSDFDDDAATATFTGDTEGSDNWSEICAVDPEGTQDAATNYPIFNFANTYGTTAGLTDTDYENGWYVPSIAELGEVYKNRKVIQTSLTKASGFTIVTRDCYYYWSSSHVDFKDYHAYLVCFYDDFWSYDKKYSSYDVFVLRALTAE